MIGLIALIVGAGAFSLWFWRKLNDPYRGKRKRCMKKDTHSMVEVLPAPSWSREKSKASNPLTGLVYGLLNRTDGESHSQCEYGCGTVALSPELEWAVIQGSWVGSVPIVAFDSNVVSIMERMRA